MGKGNQTMAKMSIPILVDWKSIEDYLKKADIIEVVMCKDCKHFLKARSEDEYDSCSILFEMQDVPLETDEDKYCAWAERRADNG